MRLYGLLAGLVSPEVPEARRRQLGIANGVLDAPVTKPILDCPRVVAGVRQRITAALPQHVRVNREGESSSLADAT